MEQLRSHCRCHISVLLLFLLAQVAPRCQGALNVGTHAAEDMVLRLRQSIFIETQYLAERQVERCSSLDGPRCFAQMAGIAGASSPWDDKVDVPGVIPEMLLSDLGIDSEGLNFSTPDFHTLQHFHEQHEASTKDSYSPKLLAGAEDALALRTARSAAERGILHFADVVPDGRIPLTFSSGLPNRLIATWDGRWIARDCHSAGARGHHSGFLAAGAQRLALPAPPGTEGKSADPYAPILAGRAPDNEAVEGNRLVSTVAELSGSVGYLRFSHPVIVRSLLARWQAPTGAVPAIVGGRLGLDGIWTTHLDPSKMRQSQSWQDLGAESLRPVDEIAFIATPGLEIGAIDVVAYSEKNAAVEERSVLLLTPLTPAQVAVAGMEEGGAPKFALRIEKLSPAAAPFVVSLQEAVERNLRLQAPIASSNSASAAVVESGSGEAERRELARTMVSNANQAMFDHKFLAHQQLPDLLAGTPISNSKPLQAFSKALAKPASSIPSSLQKEIAREHEVIAQAVSTYLKSGSKWPRSTPSVWPEQGSEEALARYMTAKRFQTKFDLLTAAFLHAAAPTLAQEAQSASVKAQDSLKETAAHATITRPTQGPGSNHSSRH